MVLRISELAERTGVSADMLRYYGRKGLLAESGRTRAGHRYHDEAAMERVRFIKGAQWLDLRLEEVGELHGDGHCGCCLPPASAGAEDEVRELEARRAAIERRLRGFVGRSQEQHS